MKHSKRFFKIILIGLLGLFIGACQNEDTLAPVIATEPEMISSLAKLGPETDYINELITIIQTMVDNGELDEGLGNSLLSKIDNVIDKIDRGNTNAASNQMNALINEVEALINNGTFSDEQGESLIDAANIIVLIIRDRFIDPRDGKKYDVVQIGNQIWMAENYAYLPEISELIEDWENPTYWVNGYEGTDVLEAMTTEHYQTYGVLYNWEAALEACPDGWHLPTHEEWLQLGQFIDGINGPYLNGAEDAFWYGPGKHLKSVGLVEDGNGLWISSEDHIWAYYDNYLDAVGTDDYGFNGLPAGIGSAQEGIIKFHDWEGNYYAGGIAAWWSSTTQEDETYSHAWARSLHFYDDSIRRFAEGKTDGFSVRYVKD